MNILILAAGKDTGAIGDSYPLCLTEFESIPLIQRVTSACASLNPSNLVAAFLQEDVRSHHLDNVIALLWPNAKTISVHEKTEGAACTALLSVGSIDNSSQLLIVNGNEYIDANFNEIVESFRERHLDAGVVVFQSIHPRYSYVALNEQDTVIMASEKNPISTNATAGFYWFANGAEFVAAAKSMIRKDARINGKFFICPVFNELILKGKTIGIYRIDNRQYHPLKNARQIENFESLLDRCRER